MKRQELRVGHVGEYEFHFWECWESDPQHPGAAERHWFRSITGLEASTYDEMLEKMSGKAVIRPSAQADTPTEWARRISYAVRVKDKDVLIDMYEHYTSESPYVPVSVSVRGPNGLVTSTYAEMLELLGIAKPQSLPPVPESQAESPPTEAAIDSITAAPQKGEAVSIDHCPPASIAPAAALVPVTSIPKKEPYREITMPKQNHHEDENYEENEIEDEEETEDDRPWPVTKQTFAEIKEMSPSELEALLENLDVHEEWQELRETAKLRVAQWLRAIKKADAAPRCQFMKLNGEPCRSPAIKGESLCYFHGETREKRQAEEAARMLEIPTLEDELGVQLAILRVCNQLAHKSIDEKTGRAIISALRLARRNLDGRKSLL